MINVHFLLEDRWHVARRKTFARMLDCFSHCRLRSRGKHPRGRRKTFVQVDTHFKNHASMVFCPTPIPENGGFRLTQCRGTSVDSITQKRVANLKGTPSLNRRGNESE
ncbi:hypothetical protein AVEN_32471-1 [Araneus ventricosus]|uniref:Uncharacterized protein n=1 Tax=Araneus ventricosus TaxID=182803 RepID=A0A4Y2ESE5_ARAVE|nr:hypothetical protein AVEN_32471-1 [Araneus ventricosus]